MPDYFDDLRKRVLGEQKQASTFGDLEAKVMGAPEQKRGGSYFDELEARVGKSEQQLSTPQPIRDTFDVTAGAAAYGAADTAELLTRGLNRSVFNRAVTPLEDVADAMHRFKERNPQYAPIEVDSVGELLTRPDALSSQLFGNAAQLAMSVGTAAIPIYGIPTAAATSYWIEAQRAYDQAKNYGATEQEAVSAGRYGGYLNAGLQVAMDLKLLKIGKGEEGLLAQRLAKSQYSALKALGPAAGMAGDAAAMGAFAAAQNLVNEGMALGTYGKPLDRDWWDKTMQAGATGAITSILLGAGGRVVKRAIGVKPDGTGPAHEVDLTVTDRDSAFQFFNQKGLPEDTAKALATISDRFATQWSERTKQPKEKFFVDYINEENFTRRVEKDNGGAVETDFIDLLSQFDKEPKDVIDAFVHTLTKSTPVAELEALKKSLKITDKTPADQADLKLRGSFVRYLWDGQAPSPELAGPMESMRELLKDTYKSVSAIGGRTKINPETRAILDSLLSEETPEIQAQRKKIREVEDIVKAAFPQKKPDITFTPDELKELRAPIETREQTYELDPNSKFGYREVEKIESRKKTPEEFEAAVKAKIDEKLKAAKGPEITVYRGGEPGKPGDMGSTYYTEKKEYAENFVKGNGKFQGRELIEKKIQPQKPLDLQKPEHAKLIAEAIGRAEKRTDPAEIQQAADYIQKNGMSYIPEKAAHELSAAGYDWITSSKDLGVGEHSGRIWLELAKPQTTDPVPSKVSYEGVLRPEDEMRAILKAQYAELDRLQMSRLIPEDMSLVSRRSKSDGRERDVVMIEEPKDTQKRWKFVEKLSKEFDPVRQYFSLEGPLMKYKWGQKLKDVLGDVTAFARTVSGHYEESIVDAFRSLGYKERMWLRTVDEHGYSNIRKMLDQVGVPDGASVQPHTPNLEKFRDLAWRVNEEMGRSAERLGVVMRFPDGSQMPYQQPQRARMLRFMTDEARKAIQSGSGEVYKAISDAVKKWNPEFQNSDWDVKLKNVFKEAFVDPEIKKNSALETARAIKLMPDVVKVGGKEVSIFMTDPLHYLRRSVHSQASRLAWTKVLGQDTLNQVGTRELKDLATHFGVEPKMSVEQMRDRIRERILKLDKEKLQERIDEKYQRKVDRTGGDPKKLKKLRQPTDVESTVKEADTILSHLDQGVDDPTLSAQGLKKAMDLAKKLGINVGPERQDYVDALNRVTVKSMSPEALKKLPSIAKKMKGIRLDLDPDSMLSEIKRRAMEDPISNLDNILTNLNKESGGHADPYAMQLVKASQGIPLVTNDRNLFLRNVKLGSQVLGTFQTSLSALRNVPQTAMLVPVYTGLKNYFGALDSVMKHYNMTKSQLLAMGTMQDSVHSAGFEKGYWLESTGAIIRNLGSSITGLKYIAEFNNMVAGEAFRRMALEWRSDPKGLGKGDLATMKSLGLTPDEIKSIQAGQMSNLTFNKIAQEGTAMTQFVTTSAQKRGKFEHNPIAQMIVSYANYSIGTGRAMSDLIRNHVAPAFQKNSDFKTKAHAFATVATVLGATLGAGLTSQILVDAIKGDMTKEMDDSTLNKMTGALWEGALIGPTQRVLDTFRFGGGDYTQYVTSMMPQIKALSQGIGAMWNQISIATQDKSINDKNARLGAKQGMWEMLKSNTPMVKAFAKWVDKASYPEITDYDEVKASSARWKRDRSKTLGGASDYPIDPDKAEVFHYVARGDSQNAILAAQKYYENYMNKMVENPKDALINGRGLDKARTGLRASLQGQAPINVGEGMPKLDYLSSLPDDQLKKFYQVDAKYRALMDLVAPHEDK